MVRAIGKGIINCIISFMTIFGIVVITFLYLQGNNIQVFGNGKETIIYADSNTRDNIADTLNIVSREEKVNVSNYITDIYVVDDINKIQCKDKLNVIGCEIPQKNIFGPIRATIYIRGDGDGYYSDKCDTFEFVKYHEIGHALYDLKFGIPDNQDDSYRKSLETYANSIAKKYASFDKKTKKGCKEYYLEQEVETAKKKLDSAADLFNRVDAELNNAKIELDNWNREVQNEGTILTNSKNFIENSETNLLNSKNELVNAGNKLAGVSVLDKLQNTGAYQNALAEYNSAQNNYANYLNIYNNAQNNYNSVLNQYNSDVNNYNSARDRYNNLVNMYNADLNSFKSASDNYNDKVRMAQIAISDEEMIDKGYN